MSNRAKSLSEIIGSANEFEKVRSIMAKQQVIAEFYAIFPAMKDAVLPVKVEKKTLYLRVDNPAWRNELKFHDTELIEKINAYFKEERINMIKFVIS